jgi:hypothetical protein
MQVHFYCLAAFKGQKSGGEGEGGVILVGVSKGPMDVKMSVWHGYV